jgi:hypothetical protein
MAGQEEILSRGNSNHNATLSAIETAKNETVHAVIEHLEKTLTLFVSVASGLRMKISASPLALPLVVQLAHLLVDALP